MKTDKTPLQRAKELLAELSLEEKLHQLTAQMLFNVDESYEKERDPLCGCFRNPGHFMHQNGKISSPGEVTRRINRDVEMSIAAQPHGIPPLEHGESLHGAQWGMASIFPQPIGLASTFDPEAVEIAADIIGKETAAVGVRQALAPVVNISRDVRWGRTIETFGEDPKLASDMGAAMCRGFSKNGVAATPKHFVDNYADGGRDSNYSTHSERELREVYLKPFEACFKEGGALGVMAAYNSLFNGLPAHANPWLLTKVLRDEWGFEGIVVSDYGGVHGVAGAHELAADTPEAVALCLGAGLDVTLHHLAYEDIRAAYERGLLTEEVIDRAVLRLLTVKFAVGLFDQPFADPDEADRLVRCEAHKAAALETAKKSLVLFENKGALPLDRKKIKTLGIFGPGADVLPTGRNYSGPYAHLWEAPDVLSPLAYFRAHAGGIEIVTGSDAEISSLAPRCDAALYFTAVVEGEGLDRSDLRLPSYRVSAARDDAAVIVDKAEHLIEVDQEASILALAEANQNAVVVLMNGAPVDVTAWHEKVGAILEAWYPGEGGAEAIFDALFGAYCPGGKLPVSWMKSVGQLPLFYGYKPSGRGYGYENNDGKPLHPFGWGLSYTAFEIKNAALENSESADGGRVVTVDVENTGDYDGDEVVQIYLTAKHTKVVRPVKELVGYKRVTVKKGEAVRARIPVPASVTHYYDADMKYGAHGGEFTLLVATSADDADVKAKLPL
ncbi:MAG: glycoside hydrolase family 3 C-terminal domain-containing protein [Clostridia bacterium]|nr:glycoside hydrolase family 3 C-terminal domain-containing protein [Clostridia bacterium]